MCVCVCVALVAYAGYWFHTLLRFRYTLDELRGMLEVMRERAEGYQGWSGQVEAVLDGLVPQKAGEGEHAL